MNRNRARNLGHVVRVLSAVGRPLDAGDLSVALGVGRDAVRRRLAELRDIGMVRDAGQGLGGKLWEVAE